MRGYPFNMKDAFKTGLRSVSYISRNTGALIDGINCIATKNSLVGYTPDIDEMPTIYDSGGNVIDFSISWPFPQIFQTDTGLYIGNQVGLYQIAADVTYGYVGTLLTDGFTGSINWPWTIANCPGFPIFSSGDILVYYDPDTSAWNWWVKGIGGSAGSLWNSDWYQPVSVTYNRGQVVAAGCKTYTSFPSQNREVKWSNIGKVKFLSTPLTHDDLLDTMSNTAGGMFEGSDDYGIIMRVLPLDKGFIVYSTFSVFALIPVTDPVPSFAVLPLRDIGIANPLAVGGPIKGESAGKHLFVDRMGVLWAITTAKDGNGITPQRLGYEEFLQPMQNDVSIKNRTGIISISYNPYKDEYYISNGEISYVYNGVGLTPIDRCITSMIDFQNAQVATGFHYTTLQDAAYGYFYNVFKSYNCMMQTDVIDMNVRAKKTVEGIHLGISLPDKSTCEVMLEWRNNSNSPFNKTIWKRISPEGTVTPNVTAVEFRVLVKCSDWDGFELSDMTLYWKLVDKNNVRGAYVGNTGAGGNS